MSKRQPGSTVASNVSAALLRVSPVKLLVAAGDSMETADRAVQTIL